MCGRFVGFRTLGQLQQLFPIDEIGDSLGEVTQNFNVAPTQEILAITRRGMANVLDKYHWGLVPFWAKDTTLGARMINARSETVATKPSFRTAFKKRRCLIPADGFFEWVKAKGQKQPVFITRPDTQPFAFAGLWEVWQDKQNPDRTYPSCTIITRAAEGPMQKIHHRMPVILPPEAYASWLDPNHQNAPKLQQLLTDSALTDLVWHPVSKLVNAARNNSAANLEPVQLEFDF